MSVQENAPRFLTGTVTPMVVEPVVLEGQYVRLEPLSMEHHAGMCSIGLDEELWRWTPTAVTNPDEMRKFIEQALKQRDEGSVLTFATFYKPDNVLVGSSRYMNIDHANHRLEIGSTFVGRQWQRTLVNTEAKYLMLRHAFETLGCLRVEFKTDSLNEKSRNALLRVGAKQEGIFRNHVICASGRIRHSVYFSITDEEWEATVKADLEAKLARPYTPPA